MEFYSHKTAFGRHETFQLRYGWLTKGYQAVEKNPGVFKSDEATVELGVGKNMVNSIRYWMRACRLLDGDLLTPFAHYIFNPKDGVDPYLEDEATLWLLHWKLATNPEQATTQFWFFNRFHKPVFTVSELQVALQDFARANIRNKYSAATIKNDASVLTRMYSQSAGNKKTPMEEALDSPLALLSLLSRGPGRNYQSLPAARPELSLGVFGYAVMELMIEREKTIMPIEELMYSRSGFAAPGAVFRLTENDLIKKLEQLVKLIIGVVEIRETAGIHQLYVKKEINPRKYLDKHYRQYQVAGKAA